ncbi:hypothetical protein K493DRAFT_314390 [Basidiobolus meristosporus CBS 931.73]|uniref:F-box domain-containing protein n=1 Tax=Basidiobolus meristosporus CBS 931.73 TaxID=1314790 RepID=A0A1Y1YFI0_9FUNG|nr:hypothetical protein K493DRAFT_314390 [Basidiobolus meristosporus CBS 931.73]|eukprot:ORX96708.1 hypothetical protein K493DRAFT_314390 [Basidiobolus meristosporus CBS 931.73]
MPLSNGIEALLRLVILSLPTDLLSLAPKCVHAMTRSSDRNLVSPAIREPILNYRSKKSSHRLSELPGSEEDIQFAATLYHNSTRMRQ